MLEKINLSPDTLNLQAAVFGRRGGFKTVHW